jgi:cell wall-associated NlpC family hydrolase
MLPVYGIIAQKQISINFVGEINLYSSYLHQSDGYELTNNLLKNYSAKFKDKYITFSSVSSIFTDNSTITRKHNSLNNHSIPQKYAKVLKNAGISVVSTSDINMGLMTFDGLASTCEALKNANIHFAGIKSFSEQTIFDYEGVRVGFASFGNAPHTPNINDTVKISNIIKELDKQCDIVVVAFSIKQSITKTDSTFNTYSYIRQVEQFAKKSINSGADIVYGNGTEIPLGMDLFNDRLILYGLGNFCTPSISQYNFHTGCAPVISVTAHSDGSFNKAQIYPFRQTDNNGPNEDFEKSAINLLKKQVLSDFTDTKLLIDDNGTITPKEKSATALAFEVLDEGRTHLGKRYVRGAVGPNTFDCSGLTSCIFRKIGIELHRTAISQYTQGEKVNKNELKPGDLVFFRGRASRRIGHVGVVVSVDKSKNSFNFLHACSRGVIIDDFAKSSYYISRYAGATRVIGKI